MRKEIFDINKKTKIYSADQDYLNIMTMGKKKFVDLQLLVYRKF